MLQTLRQWSEVSARAVTAIDRASLRSAATLALIGNRLTLIHQFLEAQQVRRHVISVSTQRRTGAHLLRRIGFTVKGNARLRATPV